MNSISKNIDDLINKATLYLNETQTLLSRLLEETTNTENEDPSDEDKILKIQLILQYRLCCEDALCILLKLDHNLLYSLGIHPQQSAKVNMDRLAYAVGNDDLKQILNILAILTGSLSKIIARYKNSHASFKLKNKKPQKQYMITTQLSSLLIQQNKFLEVLYQLDPEIEQLIKTEAGEPLLDEIAAIKGPISRFYLAIIHGLGQAKQLYFQLNKTPLIDYQLNTILKEVEQVLHLMPTTFNPHPNYPIKQFDHPLTSEELEQRAAVKRLRPFFG